MSNHQLQEKEALQLITPVVDGEASHEESRAFFHYLEQNRAIRQRFEDERRIKLLIQERLPRYDAPKRLRKKVYYWLEYGVGLQEQQGSSDPPSVSNKERDTNDLDRIRISWKKWLSSRWISGLFFFGVGLIFILGIFFITNPSTSFEIDKLAYRHYTLQRGTLLPGNVLFSSRPLYPPLRNSMNGEIQLPEYPRANLEKAVNYHFYKDYITPLFIHRIENTSPAQYIFTFVFNIEELQQNPRLFRNRKAMRTVQNSNHFFSQNVDGRQILSWQHGKYWYISLSNEDKAIEPALAHFSRN